jgi:hypothetical protein
MNQLPVQNNSQQTNPIPMTTRFTHFGALIIWIGVVPLYLAMIPTNPILNVIGTVALGLYLFFVYSRCDELGLMTVKVLKKNDDDDDRPLVLTTMICFIAMIAYFAFIGFNPKIFLSSYAILATIITFRVQALNEYKPGEL